MQLAKETFKALRPYLNLYRCGMLYAKEDGGNPIWMISDELIEKVEKGECPPRFLHANRLRAKHLADMIETGHKYYYTSSSGGKDSPPKALPQIDVDAHKPWQTDIEYTTEVVHSFLGKVLLGVESDRGHNAVFKLDYGRYTPRDEVNDALKEFGRALHRYCKSKGCLCDVEIKGTISTKAERGMLAKLPLRGWNYEKLERFKSLPEVSLSWLEAATAALVEATDEGKAVETELLCQQLEHPELSSAKQAPQKRVRGSVSQIPFDTSTLPQLLAKAKPHANHLMRNLDVCMRKDVKVTALDFQVALAILSQIKPCKDGAMPTKRIKGIWDHLYKEGHVTRAYCYSRWASVRNTLEDCGFLDMVDHRYWHFESDGESEGQAMKWSLKEEFRVSLETPNTQEEKKEGTLRQLNYPQYAPFRSRPQWTPPPRRHLDELMALWEERCSEEFALAA